MEKKSKPVAPYGDWVKKKIIKLIAFFTCVVLIFVNLFMFSFSPYGIGYKYYENNTIQIGVSQQNNIVSQTIDNYLAELEENGYYICLTEVNKNIIYQQTIIRRSEINNQQLQQIIKNSISVSVFAVKLLITNDNAVYYFKSESECNKFVSDLKEYNENIEIVITNEIIEVHQITNNQVLQDTIQVYRLDRESRDREAAAALERQKQKQKQSQVIASRSGHTRIDTSSNSHHPLDSYTYISSKFGQRSSGFHTGVDFATPIGTKVHAWKAGTVTHASWSGGYGNYITIRHDDGTVSCYAHLNSYACSVGDYVDCHEIIAYSGSTGNSTRSAFTFWN